MIRRCRRRVIVFAGSRSFDGTAAGDRMTRAQLAWSVAGHRACGHQWVGTASRRACGWSRETVWWSPAAGTARRSGDRRPQGLSGRWPTSTGSAPPRHRLDPAADRRPAIIEPKSGGTGKRIRRRGLARWNGSPNASPGKPGRALGCRWCARRPYVVTGGLGGIGLLVCAGSSTTAPGRIVLNGAVRRPTRPGDLADSAAADRRRQRRHRRRRRGRAARRRRRGTHRSDRCAASHSAAVLGDQIVAALSRDSLEPSGLPRPSAPCGCEATGRARDLDWWIGSPRRPRCWVRPGSRAAAASSWLDGHLDRLAQGQPVCQPPPSTGASGPDIGLAVN